MEEELATDLQNKEDKKIKKSKEKWQWLVTEEKTDMKIVKMSSRMTVDRMATGCLTQKNINEERLKREQIYQKKIKGNMTKNLKCERRIFKNY